MLFHPASFPKSMPIAGIRRRPSFREFALGLSGSATSADHRFRPVVKRGVGVLLFEPELLEFVSVDSRPLPGLCLAGRRQGVCSARRVSAARSPMVAGGHGCFRW
jgi:hypothetical protein